MSALVGSAPRACKKENLAMKKRSNGIKQHAPRTLQGRELGMITGGTSEIKSDRDSLLAVSQEINRNLK